MLRARVNEHVGNVLDQLMTCVCEKSIGDSQTAAPRSVSGLMGVEAGGS